MDPVTHALSSLAVARVAGKSLPRFGTAMIVAAGLAPDLDYASYILGPHAFLQLHLTLLHSAAGSLLLACILAGAFCYLDRKHPAKVARTPVKFLSALAACCAGILTHLALDLCNADGVQLLWPFKAGWWASDIAADIDIWIIAILAVGIVLPYLFRLISEEIGEHRRGPAGRGAAIAVLLLTIGYLSYRATLHSRAVNLLLSREYHGRIALSAGAFPDSSSPFDWRGVIVTDNTIEEVNVALGPGKEANTDRSLTHYKPEDSPEVTAGEKAAATAQFLKYARFPIASVRRMEADYRFEVHDLRFAPDDTAPSNVFVRVDLDSDFRVKHESFLFASSPNP